MKVDKYDFVLDFVVEAVNRPQHMYVLDINVSDFKINGWIYPV